MTPYSKPAFGKLKTANWTISTLVFLTNIYFLPISFITIKSTGGAFGYGLLILPISLSINLLLVTTGLTFKTKFNKSVGLLIINVVGLLWALFWMWLLLTTPKMDWLKIYDSIKHFSAFAFHSLYIIGLPNSDNYVYLLSFQAKD